MKSNVLTKSGLALLVAVTISGCTFNFGSSGSDRGGNMMNNGGPMSGSNSDSGFSASDIMFAQMMIPHHQQAVDMGTLAETRAASSEVKELAAEIKAEQFTEIEQMTSWIESAGASMDMGHDMGDMGMGGMLTDEQMKELENKTGAEFDALFLSAMIEHHEGAIQMAQMILNSKNAEAKALGESIVSSQTEQIALMKSLQ